MTPWKGWALDHALRSAVDSARFDSLFVERCLGGSLFSQMEAI